MFSSFRWVALQLDSLECCRIAQDVDECLESLPEGLDETYDRILSKITGQDRKWAIRILQCLAFSARLMTLNEVGEVVAFNPDNGQFNQRLPNPKAVLEICSSLITISSGTGEMEGKSESKICNNPISRVNRGPYNISFHRQRIFDFSTDSNPGDVNVSP